MFSSSIGRSIRVIIDGNLIGIQVQPKSWNEWTTSTYMDKWMKIFFFLPENPPKENIELVSFR